MKRKLDLKKVDVALKRAARRAAYGTPGERSGRFLVSSVIKSVDYDEQTGQMDVTFIGGKKYRYTGVPLSVYVDFLEAGSKGQYFNSVIREAFDFTEVAEAENISMLSKRSPD